MKKIFALAIFLAAVMLLTPLSVIKSETKTLATAASVKIPKADKAVSESFKVKDSDGKISTLDREEYIFGVLAAEMPALYDGEALKAQAVAAYTFACYKKAVNQKENYDITTDFTVDQSFITEKAAKEKWGDKAEEYTEKLKNVIKSVNGYMITYDGKPINALYHAISSGKTENASDIWGGDLPYLKSVVSEGDRLSPDYISQCSFSGEEIRSKLSGLAEISGEEKNYFKITETTKSGTVKKIILCKTELTGEKIHSALDLRSSNFTVEYKDGSFIFTVYGYGHGVGMSQNGANYMAKQGSNFKEILVHYYSGCKVQKINS